MITNMSNEEMFEGIMVFCANCNLYYLVADCKFEYEHLKCPRCGEVLIDMEVNHAASNEEIERN